MSLKQIKSKPIIEPIPDQYNLKGFLGSDIYITVKRGKRWSYLAKLWPNLPGVVGKKMKEMNNSGNDEQCLLGKM